MLTRCRLAASTLAAALLLTAGAARAQISMEVKSWQLTVSGGAGGFATMNFCDKSATPAVNGGIACAVGPAGENRAAVESGLMPGFLNVQAKTTSGEWEVGGDLGFFSGLNSAGAKTGFANTTMDLRKNFAFFGRKDIGSFKIGRDVALFGSDAIFNDMSLVGAGSGAALPVGFQTTNGRIGVGYIYADWAPQLTYTSPVLGGLQVALSLIQAWTPFDEFGGNVLDGHKAPGAQAKVTYDLAGPVPVHLWAGGWYQTAQSRGGAIPTGTSLTTTAYEVGARVSPVKELTLVGYFYGGDGAGTQGVGFQAFAWDGARVEARRSMGYYAQATYAFGALKLGASYGASTLDLAANETAATNPALVKSNASVIGGLYYALSPNLTLTAEWTTTTSKSHGGASVTDNAVALGGYVFF